MTDLTTPRRTSPLAALFGIVDVDRTRALLPIVVIAFTSGRAGLVLGLAAVVSITAGILTWLRRLWWFSGDVLHLDEGVFVRNQRRIPVERIQHVELERRLRHQLFGLAAVRVETAGGTGAELRLDAIPRDQAEALRHAVQTAAATAGAGTDEPGGPATEPAAPTTVLVRLPPARLVLAGVTGPEVIAVLTALAIGIDALTDLGVDPEQVESVEIGSALAVLLAVVALPAWFLTAGLIAVVRKWDLTAAVRGDELRVTYGLLRRQEFVMRTARVQDARVAQRLLLRPFGRADLRIRSAASGAGESSRVDIPLLDDVELDRVLARVLPETVPRPSLWPAPAAARRRALLRGVVVGSAVGVLLAVVLDGAADPLRVAAGLAAVAGGAALGLSWYRGLGWAESAGVHHSRTGLLARRTALVPAWRVQSAAVVATLFQRRRGLASVRLDLAGGRVTVVDRALGRARRIAAAVTVPPASGALPDGASPEDDHDGNDDDRPRAGRSPGRSPGPSGGSEVRRPR